MKAQRDNGHFYPSNKFARDNHTHGVAIAALKTLHCCSQTHHSALWHTAKQIHVSCFVYLFVSLFSPFHDCHPLILTDSGCTHYSNCCMIFLCLKIMLSFPFNPAQVIEWMTSAEQIMHHETTYMQPRINNLRNNLSPGGGLVALCNPRHRTLRWADGR